MAKKSDFLTEEIKFKMFSQGNLIYICCPSESFSLVCSYREHCYFQK